MYILMNKMMYIEKRYNGIYYYCRRVPSHLHDVVGMNRVYFSLKTKDPQTAQKKAAEITKRFDKDWDDLLLNGGDGSNAKYDRVKKIAKMYGFQYLDIEELLKNPKELFARTSILKNKINPQKATQAVDALLGGVEKPINNIKLSNLEAIYWENNYARLMGKSDLQIRKTKQPTKREMAFFIDVVGNKYVNDLTRQDGLDLQKALIDRIEGKEIQRDTANKTIGEVKKVISEVAKVRELDINPAAIFDGLRFKMTKSNVSTRQSYDRDFLVNQILNNPALENCGHEARSILKIIAETGARITEIVGLMPEDIVLDDKIPHIHIRPNDLRNTKNQNSIRVLPIVGYALDAFKEYPKGFKLYKNNRENLSAVLNKFMSENGMRPTENHSLNSMRHSFQDRLRDVRAPEKIQSELFGHGYSRVNYGRGHTLEDKLYWMEKVCLK